MAVLAIKTELKCKLCKSQRRGDIDALLELRSDGKSDDAGARINLDYVLRVLDEWGVPNPTKENVTNHWKKHCEVVTAGQATDLSASMVERHSAAMEVFERVLGAGWRATTPTVDQVLELQRALYVLNLEALAEVGAPLGITHDHFLKGADSSTKRKQEESVGKVLHALGAGIGSALIEGAAAKKGLPAGEEVVVEDAEEVSDAA